MKLCECGCGAEVKKRFKPGHYQKTPKAREDFLKQTAQARAKGYRTATKRGHRSAYKSAATIMANRFAKLLGEGLTIDRTKSRKNRPLKRVKL